MVSESKKEVKLKPELEKLVKWKSKLVKYGNIEAV